MTTDEYIPYRKAASAALLLSFGPQLCESLQNRIYLILAPPARLVVDHGEVDSLEYRLQAAVYGRRYSG
jgi:hypothetical protein